MELNTVSGVCNYVTSMLRCLLSDCCRIHTGCIGILLAGMYLAGDEDFNLRPAGILGR